MTTVIEKMHLDLGLAKLHLKGRFDTDEINDAADELLRKGYVVLCPQHENCVHLTPTAAAS